MKLIWDAIQGIFMILGAAIAIALLIAVVFYWDSRGCGTVRVVTVQVPTPQTLPTPSPEPLLYPQDEDDRKRDQ
ncbi:MAG: hypothetical protein Q8Q09_03810 [Deltaproteobacteria bacterium]|nr:hypothetical protein [Deltaproteobacteria bacterium]